MKKFIFILLALWLLTLPISALSDAPLKDSAALLSEEEAAQLNQTLTQIREKRGITVAAATVPTIYGQDALVYADFFYDHYAYGTDGVLLLLSMSDRDWALTAVGAGYQAINDDAQDYIMDQVLPLLKQDRYAEAFQQYAALCDRLIEDYQAGRTYKKPFPRLLFLAIALGVGLLAALITVSIMAGKLKTVRPQTGAAAYMEEGSMNLTGQEDRFLYSNVTRTARPKESSSHSGGGSGGFRGGRSGKF